VAPRAQRHGLTAALVLAGSLSCLAGCGRSHPVETIDVGWTLDPSPPVVGVPTVARVTLRDAGQKPLTGARLRLVGLMSHPGMAPVTATLVERVNGEYEAPLQFTMAGDWILLVTGELPGGGQFENQIEIAGVRPSS
jgi:hypothetical protein